MKFYNREKEFEALNSIKDNFRVALIGRRRIGKTSLVKQFYGDRCVNFFVPAEKSEKEIISDWVRENSQMHLPSVNTFNEFFDFVFYHHKEKVIFIDELQNSIKVNKSFLFDLQKLVDRYKPNLVVAGSIISLMKEIAENYKSPLYGRFDYILKLKELSFRTIYKICADLELNIEEAINIYSVFGGVPKYYELIEKIADFEFEKFVFSSFISYPRPLYEEVRSMLKEEFGKEYKTFFSILSSISQGKNKSSEIAGFIGRKSNEITKYLSLLADDFEIIERKVPIIGSKKGIYIIKNNIISFWFSNIWKHAELLESSQEEKIKLFFKDNLHLHVSKNFENISKELIENKILLNEFEFSSIGKQWGNFLGKPGKNSYEVDILALNEEKKETLFGECKWTENINALSVVNGLSEKAKYVDWHNREREESFVVFAKSFTKKISEFEGKKVYCFDLRDIEKALKD